MLPLWFLLTTTVVASHKVVDSTEDIPPEPVNITTLYPIGNKTKEAKQNTATSWKIETTFAESGLADEEVAQTNGTVTASKEELVLGREEGRNASKEFKPSPQLESFFDGQGLEVTPTKETFGPFSPVIRKPPTGFLSSLKPKFPKEMFKNHNKFPYKFENAILTKTKDSWLPTSGASMESKPTAEVPVRVPAGGLYQLTDAFKEKPGSIGDDEDFGLEFNGEKETLIKKRPNPWKRLLHLMTALIPVGLIVSALTPSVITISNVDNQIPGPILRRTGTGAGAGLADLAGLPAISEGCRRRLLCELQSDRLYSLPPSARGRRACQRMRCAEPEALSAALDVMLRRGADAGDDDVFNLNTT